ncbi:DUF2314 domain-containing protein [Planctomycetota bacterium]
MFVFRLWVVALFLCAIDQVGAEDPAVKRAVEAPDDVATVRSFFQKVQEATADDSGKELLELMDTNRYYNEIFKATGQKLNFFQRIAMKRRANSQIAPRLVKQFGVWTSYTASNINVDGVQATALVRHWNGDGISDRQVFMLHRHGKSWRFYDIHSVSIGMSMLDAAKAAVGQVRSDPAAMEMARATQLVSRVTADLFSEDFSDAANKLEKLRGMRLPKAFQLPRRVMEIAIQTQDSENATYNLHMAKRVQASERDCLYVDYLLGLCYSDVERHEDSIRSAKKYIASVGPDADSEYAISLACDSLGRKDEAIEACLRGLDDTPHSLDLLHQLALLMPEERLREFAMRFAKLPQPKEYFEGLAGSLSYAGRPQALEALVDVYEELAPGDPNVVYYRAQAKAEQEEYVVAADLLKPVISTIEDADEREFYVNAFLDDMAMAGKSLDAYNALSDDRSYAFRYLVESLMDAEKNDEARTLIQHHRIVNPEDPAGVYFEGNLLLQEDKTNEAITRFLKAQTMFPDAEISQQIDRDLATCWIRLDKPLEAYRRATDKEQAFSDLSSRLYSRPDARLELIDLHEREYGRSIETIRQRLETWRQQEKHADVLRMAQQVRSSLANGENLGGEELSESHAFAVNYQLFSFEFRSLIGMRRFDEALTVATEQKTETGDPYHEAVAYAHLGDVESCEAAIEYWLNSRNYEPERLLGGEEELREILLTKPFERVWTRFFLRRLISLTVFQKTPSQRTTDEFVAIVSKEFDGESFDVYADGGTGKSDESYIEVHSDHAFTVNYQSHSFFVMWQNDPYEFSQETQEKLRDGRIKTALDHHQAWFAVDLDVWPGSRPTDVSYQLFARLLHALLDSESALAIMDTEKAEIVCYSNEIDQLLQSEYPRNIVRKMSPFPIDHWDESLPATKKAFEEAKRRWPEFVEVVRQKSGETCYVLAELTDGEESERIWVDVESVDGETVRGKLNSRPIWLKGMTEGDKISIQITDVDDWMYDRSEGESVGGFSLDVTPE